MYLLSVQEHLTHCGTGLTGLQLMPVPRHVEALQVAFDRLGLSPAEFRAFRVEIAYPVVGSLVGLHMKRMRFPL